MNHQVRHQSTPLMAAQATATLIVAAVVFSVIPATVVAEIKTTDIVADARPMILFEEFGFRRSGQVSVSITGLSLSSLNVNPNAATTAVNSSRMGFVLVRESNYANVNDESDYAPAPATFCILDSRWVLPVLRLSELSEDSTTGRTRGVDGADEHSLIFGNCQPEAAAVTMSVRTEMYNFDASGGRDYLSAGRAPVPRLFAVFFVVYILFFAAWGVVCFRQRVTAEKIHAVMAALLLFKALKLLCAAEDLWHVQRTGNPHGWDVAFYVFGFFKGVLLFTVIVLVGTGWSFLKPYLHEREKNILMIVIPMQVIENIAVVVIGETGPAERDYLTWNQIFLVVDFVCCAAVFFPIIWSIRNLREASKSDGKAARNLQKLTLFKQFYLVVIVYIYFTRIVVSAVAAVLPYERRWAVTAAEEGASLAFYLFIFHNFQPVEKNPYLYVGDEEEAAAAEKLEMEEFSPSFEL